LHKESLQRDWADGHQGAAHLPAARLGAAAFFLPVPQVATTVAGAMPDPRLKPVTLKKNHPGTTPKTLQACRTRLDDPFPPEFIHGQRMRLLGKRFEPQDF